MTGTEWARTRSRVHTVALPDVSVPPLPWVRTWVDRQLADLAREVVEDVMLVVTELVANAYEHGTGPRALCVERRDRPGRIMIEVDDRSSALPVLDRSRLGTNRGRGVRIVAGLAADWGVQSHPEGKTVWAAIAF